MAPVDRRTTLDLNTTAAAAPEDVLGSMPRRKPLEVTGDRHRPPAFEAVDFPRASTRKVLWRIFGWLRAVLRYEARIGFARLRGGVTDQQRGRLMRRMFEEMGGTGIKLGQQMSIRIDLLPYEVCEELAAMLDRIPPFATAKAVKIIEAAIGGPLNTVFRRLDPKPIGSASVACVYQAELLSGDKVAVKVQRPNIAVDFDADLQAFEALLLLSEVFLLVRPGFFRHLRTELRNMLMEELDFRTEARYQRLFRKYARKDRLKWVTAPKVYDQYTSTNVIVSEFISGVWVSEIIAAVEMNDQEALKFLRENDIDPEKIGRRIMRLSYWSMHEALFIHTDPHPANVIVRPGNKIVMIDFGSCGTISRRSSELRHRVSVCSLDNDISGMAEAALQLFAPLPPIDVEELRKHFEAEFARVLFGLRDPKAEWWEKTTAGMWIRLTKITRAYRLQVNLETIRLFRATMLYDTLGARLWPGIDNKEFRRYLRKANLREDRRAKRRQRQRDLKGGRLSRRAQRDQMHRQLEELRWRVDRYSEDVPMRIQAMTSKSSYMVAEGLRFLVGALILTAIAVGAYRYTQSHDDFAVIDILQHPLYLVGVTLLLLFITRRVLFRLNDVD